MDRLKQILACFPSKSPDGRHDQEQKPLMISASSFNEKAAGYNPATNMNHYAFPSEKAMRKPNDPVSTQEVAAAILSTLRGAQKASRDVDLTVQDIVVQAGGWYERIAVAVLNALQSTLMEGHPLANALGAAYEKARDAADGIADFAREHPLYTAAICAVIALGILEILAPSLVAALGFGGLGPVDGSWAATWESTYGGVVESGSLFSYLQRLGMILK